MSRRQRQRQRDEALEQWLAAPERETLYGDTHCHVSAAVFDEDRAEVLERARLGGLTFLVDVATDADSARRSRALAESDERIFTTVGVHPHEASRYTGPELENLLAESNHPRVVALGEMGLDYHYDYSPRADQREVFRRQIAHALATDKPVIIHARESEEEALDILEHDFDRFPRGVWHCYMGDSDSAGRILEAGMFISIAGIVTFRQAGQLRELAASLPLERLLVETDCPYLAPVPFRGRRNEPLYVKGVVDEIARLRSCPPEVVAARTARNAIALFDLPVAIEEARE